MSTLDRVLVYLIVLEVQRLRILRERVTRNGTVTSSAAYLDYLQVRGIVIPVLPALGPWDTR